MAVRMMKTMTIMTRSTSIKTYSELITIPTFEERFQYLKLDGRVGEETFGSDRYLNQKFYTSREWQDIRNHVIVRDHGCDLAMLDREIPDGVKILIHHMNPITAKDIVHRSEFLIDPEFLISTIKLTHDAIHYGDERLLMLSAPVERRPNDTCPWRH